MNKEELALQFDKIANLLEIKGELIFKVRAYRNAAEGFRQSSEDIEELIQSHRLGEIPGVGDAIAKKTEELMTTGKLEFLKKLETEVPLTLLDVLAVPGISPRKTALFWKQAGVVDLPSLKRATEGGKLRALPGMGQKAEEQILQKLIEMEKK
jgi:DNA polymerase (family 10)